MPAGPKFETVVEQAFAMQLNGKGKTVEEREKILRKLSGIKEPPKVKEAKHKEKKAKLVEKLQPKVEAKHAAPPAAAAGKQAPAKHAPAKTGKAKKK
jgi:hypothetical protein